MTLPENALDAMLRKFAKPHGLSAHQLADLKEIGRRFRAGSGVFNINSLDENDARGVEDVIDLDRERAMRDGELIEANTSVEKP